MRDPTLSAMGTKLTDDLIAIVIRRSRHRCALSTGSARPDVSPTLAAPRRRP
jgi:hypothetical protein